VRIIFNADDFGFSDDTVDATIEAFEAGLLTSATIMPAMPATERACEFAARHPEFSFGVHLTLVGNGEEQPVSAPADVASLVDRDGRLRPTNHLRARALVGAINAPEIALEVRAQIEKVRSLGVEPSHVDSHQHLHKYGSVLRVLDQELRALGIDRVRGVQDLYLRRPLVSPTRFLGERWSRDLSARFTSTDHFYMPATAGDADWRALLPQLAGPPEQATLEIGVHPGRSEDWRRAESAGLRAFAPAALADGHATATWRDVG